jgi:hypothetical protein
MAEVVVGPDGMVRMIPLHRAVEPPAGRQRLAERIRNSKALRVHINNVGIAT